QPKWAFTLSCSLFLAPPATYTAGRQPSPFDIDAYGDFLEKQWQTQYRHAPPTIFGHEPTLRAAFNLTGCEFTLIATYLKFDSHTQLTLENISKIFRIGWLARKLRISVDELLQLRHFTALDPFAPLDLSATPPAVPPMLCFIRLLQALANAGLRPAQALYLI